MPAIKPNFKGKATKGPKTIRISCCSSTGNPSAFSRFACNRLGVLENQEYGSKLDFISFNMALEWGLLDFICLGNRFEKVKDLLLVISALVFSCVLRVSACSRVIKALFSAYLCIFTL